MQPWAAYLGFKNTNVDNPWSSADGSYDTTTGAYKLASSTTDVTNTAYAGDR